MTDGSLAGKLVGGRYQIQSTIGHGGMATVYKAYDPNLRRDVAIKIIHPHLSDNPDFIRRFEDEATLVAQFHHANIPVIYDFDHDGNSYYIVMEYITGETLENRLKNLARLNQRLETGDAIHYMNELCAAADYAHQRGVVHRDIKPANVIIDEKNQVHLMDFGIAKIVGGQKHTATGMTVGSAHYMAPEQIQGLMLDARADIYALGATLFEMLAGRPPFEADSAMTLMMMHLTDPVPDIHELRVEVPEGINRIISKAMAKKREERFQSAVDMAAALQQTMIEPGAARQMIAPVERPIAVAATIIDTPLDHRSVSTTIEAAGRQGTPIAKPPERAFPQTPGESAYPVRAKGKRTWIYVLALFVILAIAAGAFFLRPKEASPVEPTNAGPAQAPPTQAQPSELPGVIVSSPTALQTSLPVPTETMEPTRVATLTPVPTATEIPRPNNSGFIDDCIDTNFWAPYKLSGISEDPPGCWNLAHWGMSAEKGTLLVQTGQLVYGTERSIYRNLPQSALVKFHLRVDELLSLSNLDGGLAFGIGRPENWQNAGRYVIFRRNEANPEMQIYLSSGVKNEGSFVQNAGLKGEYEIEILYANGEASFYLDGVEIGPPAALPANILEDPVFSIGYSLPADGNITARIPDLTIEER